MQQLPPRTAILILGMHRSGTSALTRVVSLLGADLPVNLMPPAADDNEKGFWESLDIFHVNEDILTSAGSSWDDWGRFNGNWFRSGKAVAYFSKARQFLENDFGSSALFVLKDPRICRLLPFWLKVLQDEGVVSKCLVTIRHPLEVAESLSKRNGFSHAKSLILWLRYVLDAELSSRDLPRAFCSYAELLADWRSEMTRLGTLLDLSWPRLSPTAEVEIDTFLEVRLRHHVILGVADSALSSFQIWVKDAFEALQALQVDPYGPDAMANLDAIRQEFDRASDSLRILAREEEVLASRLSADLRARDLLLEESRSKLMKHDDRIQAIELELAERDMRIQGLAGELAHRDDCFSALSAEVTQRDAKLGELLNELARRDKRLEELDADLSASELRLTAMSGELARRQASAAKIAAELSRRDARLNEIRYEMARRDQRLEELAVAIAAREAGVASMQECLEESAEQLRQRDVRLAEMKEQLVKMEERLESFRDEVAHRDDRLAEASMRLAASGARIDQLSGEVAEQMASLEKNEIDAKQRDVMIQRLRVDLEQERQRLQELTHLQGQLLIRLSRIQHSPAWYLSQPLWRLSERWPGIAERASSALKLGWWAFSLRLPERLRLRRHAKKLLSAQLFDQNWYIERNPDIVLQGLNPIMHWLVAGYAQQRDPCPLFDSQWYLQQSPGLSPGRINPLLHYLAEGASQGLSPHPLFDGKWYFERYPDAAASGLNPLVHYLSRHPSERRDPHPLFDTNWYLGQNEDVERSGVNALVHYLIWGATGYRNPNAYFDSAWYLEQYPEVARQGLNPLVHYYRWGAVEGKDPSPRFATAWYISCHPEVTQARQNPLAHFLREGINAGWAGHPAALALLAAPRGANAPANSLPQISSSTSQAIPAGGDRADERSQVDLIGTIRASQEPGPYHQHELDLDLPQVPVRLIAFYLPQFHPVPENDFNWGKGFTEWTNASRAIPVFRGHYQPRIPGELGYYDLRDPGIQRRQMEMARAHGIGGFCYHHYWFGGKKVLRRPIETHLADRSLDLPFCINWANEPWTASWDGHKESGVLIDQIHTPEDDLAFIRDIEPYLRDERYIRIDGKPLLAVYRPTLFPEMAATIERWQDYCLRVGIGELFTAMVQSFEVNDPRGYGFDAAIEFPPHNSVREPLVPECFFPGVTPPQVWSYQAMARGSLARPRPDYTWFRGLTLGWDNSPRKAQGWVFHGSNPDTYGEWLSGQCRYALDHLPADRRLVFINAWNEWAEGAYLEPDRHFGFAYLNRTGEVLNRLALETAPARKRAVESAPSLESSAPQSSMLKPAQTALAPHPAITPTQGMNPDTALHLGDAAPARALLDYVTLRHGPGVTNWLRHHFARFGLPVTAEECQLAEPTAIDIDGWLAWITDLAAARPSQLEEPPQVSILVPVYNQVRFTLACLAAILVQTSRYRYEILVGDDASVDATPRLADLNLPGIRYQRHPVNLGFLRNCNAIAAEAQGRYVVLLNNDTLVLPGWLEGLIDPLEEDPGIGLVGSKLIYPDGRLQEAGSVIWDDGGGWNWGNLKDPQDPEYNYRRDVDYCSGASIALPTALWRELGGFDAERYTQAYYEDTDLAFRIREDQGLRVIYQPLSHLIHFEGISSGRSLDSGVKRFQETNKPRFAARWRQVIIHHGNPKALPENFRDRRAGKKVLLIDVVTPLPDQDSGSVDTYNYLRIFLRLGLQVSLLPVNGDYRGPYVRDLQRMGVRVLHDPYRPPFEEALRAEAPRADIIFIYRETAHRYMPLLRTLVPDTPIVFNTVDLHFLRQEREADLAGTQQARQTAEDTRRKELAAMDLADATIVLSRYEESLLADLKPGLRLARIPIVRDIPGRSPVPFEVRRDLVFIGGFLHTPNGDAVRYFVQEIWPWVRELDLDRPCRFIIAGSNIPPDIKALASPDIVILGHVPDLAELYDRALISVAPLRYGAGLKGKVISSLCHGVPVVGTSVSLEGAGLEDGEHVLAAEGPQAWAEAVARLHRDPDLWYRLSEAGLAFTRDHFSLEAVTGQLDELLTALGVLGKEDRDRV